MKNFLAFGIILLFTWSCNNSKQSPNGEGTETQTEEHSVEHSGAIELDNGKKWVVNEEMKPFILKGSELTNTYVQEKQTDYQALAKQLKEQNDQLINSCTMEGKSHEELHKWLLPHLALVKDLEKAGTQAEADSIVRKLAESYAAYNTYFE